MSVSLGVKRKSKLTTLLMNLAHDTGTDADPESTEKPELTFHKSFNSKNAGDVILQAGDDDALCFYFRLPLLSELSTFFANLPPPSNDDLVDGTALIPLHDTTSRGLEIFLSAIRSIS